MKRRIIAMLCVLALMLGMLNTVTFAADADTEARSSTQSYTSLQAAVDAYESGVITLEADAQDLTVEKDTYLDLNGHNIENVSVTGGTLYCMDSQTDDYAVDDGVYGKLTGMVTGNVAGVPVDAVCVEDGYLMVTGGEGISFHRVKLQIYAMSLRAGNVGVYYKSHFIGDEVVAENVQSFGVALSVVGAPTAENMQTQCGYSRFEGFKAGEGSNSESSTGTLLYGIMKSGNTDAVNSRNAEMSVYGRPYIKTADGLMFGAVVSRDLRSQVEAVDGVWSSLLSAQKATVLEMYESYGSVMDAWNIPNIKGAEDPGAEPDDGVITLPISVTAENGLVTEAITVSANGITVTVPAGVKLAEGASALTVIVTPKETSDAGLTLEDSQVLIPMDVHVDGISADNTVPLTIHLGKIMPENLNLGNYTIYHVENGMANEMTLVAQNAEFTAHNQYKYTLDGEVILYMATFSEVAAVANEENFWKGERDYRWYDASKDELEIRNADQLAAFGAIVGGMDGQTQDSFKGKTVKLLADINIGDIDSENGIVFYPIGYYNTDGTYEKTNTAITSGFEAFQGTFDGNGNTISNFYQNTWEMKGDNNYYDATLQYYRDGMGLFGKVYGGTVKNLTVENFSSDGEYTTTGVIAAYADCGAAFENISIFNSNPRVYNIGNGGIVGCVGWYANDDVADPVSFKNITVDNSNKISALWGSYDVACGGLVGQYYPTSGQSNAIENSGIYMENCHVSAQMDVYNDVCGNYQYYAYRYAGILIGSVRENVTVDGHVYPNMDGITASGCTVHFGTWNDYYYCELVDNTTASYTHDHQMSRLEQVESVNVENKTITTLKGETVAIPTSGRVNYVVVNGKHATENATCYHFLNGEVWNHEMGGIQEGVDENGDGQDDLKEDKQHIYLEFNNLVTGYGWGVTSKGVDDMEGVEILDRLVGDSVEKFEKADNAQDSFAIGATVTIGELFKAAAIEDEKLTIQGDKVQVTVSPADENSKASGTYAPNTTDWTQGKLTFTGTGVANITITDYYFCTPTTITVTIEDNKPVDKFEAIGNTAYAGQPVKLGDLFAAKDGATIVDADVVVTGATYVPNADDWTQGTITFENAGSYTVTITDNNLCNTASNTVTVSLLDAFEIILPNYRTYLYRVGNLDAFNINKLFAINNANSYNLGDIAVTAVSKLSGAELKTVTTTEAAFGSAKMQFANTFTGPVVVTIESAYANPVTLNLEVVTAKNAIATANATSNNVVLLDDIGFSSITVSGGYTLYGNGFTMTCSSDSASSDRGYGFVTLTNGVLDNVQIECPNFSHSILYESNKTQDNNPTDDTGKRYYNIKSAVIASGNNRIQNSKISGGRAAVYITNGNTVIDNSTIVGGAAANIHVGSANNLTLKDVTLIQIPTKATVNDTSKTVMGFSIVTICDAEGKTTPITLEGDVVQYAWAHKGYSGYIPKAGTSLISFDVVDYVMKQEAFVHKITYSDGTTADSVNLGICYLPDSKAPNKPVVNDNRPNQTAIPYQLQDINGSAYVYSIANTVGTDSALTTQPDVYEPNEQGAVLPDVVFGDTNENRVMDKAYNAETNAWAYSLTVNLDAAEYTFDFAKLDVEKGGQKLAYTVTDANGSVVDTTKTISVAAGTETYTLTVTDNVFYDVEGNLVADKTETYVYTFALIGTETSKDAPQWSSDANGSALSGSMNATFEAGLCVASSYGGTWSGAAPALQNVYVRYYSTNAKEYKIINLADYTPTTTGTIDGTDTTITIAGPDFTLTLTGGQVHSSNKINAMPVVVKVDNVNKLFFVASSSNGLVNSGNSARSVPVTYTFTDDFGNTLTGSRSWSVAENKDQQYKYSDFCNGTLTQLKKDEGCVTPDTLVTLADGTQKRIDEVTYEDQLLVWDFVNAEYTAMPSIVVRNHGYDKYRVLKLKFSDDSTVNVIAEHGFFDVELNEFVMIDEFNIEEYIGHEFVQSTENGYTSVTLESYTVEEEYTAAYSILTAVHYNCILGDMLTLTPNVIGGNYFMPFEVGEDMKFDAEKMQADIELYGLFTYGEFADFVTEEQFYALNAPQVKVAVGKGIITMEQLFEIIETLIPKEAD